MIDSQYEATDCPLQRGKAEPELPRALNWPRPWGSRKLQGGLSSPTGLPCGLEEVMTAEELLNHETLPDSVQGRLAVSEDIFSCHTWRRGMLLESSEQRPRALLNFLECAELSDPKYQWYRG